MEEAERRVPPQRKADPDHLPRPYLDVCLSDEGELSDWSEEDLSLHFSASVLKSSESESESGPEPEPGPGPGLDPGPEPRPEPGQVLDQAQPDQTGPQSQVQSLNPYLDLPEKKPRPQQEQPRPYQFQRQHSLPEAGGGAYKGLIAGLQTQSVEAQVQRRLQKSFSLDESRTKMASCLIKNVLSKRMQHQAPLQSKPPRGHTIKLAASLSQSQCRAETSQPITGQRCSSQPITARTHPDQSEPRSKESPRRSPSAQDQSSFVGHRQSAVRPSRELQAPRPSAQEHASSLGHSLPHEDPPSFPSRELQAPCPSAQQQTSSVGRRQSAVRPSRELQRKAPHASSLTQPESSFVGSTQPTVDPLRFSREPRDVVHTAQEETSSVGYTRPLPHRFSSSRKLQTRGSRFSPSAQVQASSLGQSQAEQGPPRFPSREAHHTLSSAQEQSSSLGHHLQTKPPPWVSSSDSSPSTGSSQEQRPSLGQRKLAVAPPWFSSRDAPRPSAQDQGSSVGRVRPLAPWSSSSGELQPRAPLPSGCAQDECSSVGCVRPALPWLTSAPGGQEFKALQRKALLDPETGQFVQVFVPVPGPTPLLHSPAPVFSSPAPSVLGYAPLLSVTPNPTLLVQVPPTVFSQTCFMLPPMQPWVFYRPT
ncbi:trithorax group protein osa-like [Periophthalmus magnuspinnatus]|uniref:trithorax group protein osa-like n=1 Tax=Periophthalmus magnuspinnatus TaxID=409849 RepID=UPI0024368265|nr:trithorax group protein osa-like [Periophthalmus magnuspinnatus]